MHKKIVILLAIFLAGCAPSSQLKPVDGIPEGVRSATAVIPIYSQKVAFTLPTTWTMGFQQNKDKSYIIEFLPKDEKIDSWNNLLTIQGIKGLADKISPEDFLTFLATNFETTCGNGSVYEKLGASTIDGHNAFTAIIGCAKVPKDEAFGIKKGQSEIGHYLAIQGEKDIYLIHKSIRGDAFNPSKPPINKSNVAAFIESIMPIELCKKGGHEAECLKPLDQ